MQIVRIDPLREHDPFEQPIEFDISDYDVARAAEQLYTLRLEERDIATHAKQLQALRNRAESRAEQFEEQTRELFREWFKTHHVPEKPFLAFIDTPRFGQMKLRSVGGGLVIEPIPNEEPAITVPAEAHIAVKLRAIIEADEAAARLKETAKLASEAARIAEENAAAVRAQCKPELISYAEQHHLPGKQFAQLSLDEAGWPDVRMRVGYAKGTDVVTVEDEDALRLHYANPLAEGDAIEVTVTDAKGKPSTEVLFTRQPAWWKLNKLTLNKLSKLADVPGVRVEPGQPQLRLQKD